MAGGLGARAAEGGGSAGRGLAWAQPRPARPAAAAAQRFADGRWWWLTTANETVYAGRDSFMTCKKAQAEGLIKFGSVVGSAANETAPAAGVAA